MLYRVISTNGFHPCYRASCGDILVGWEDPVDEATIIATGNGDVAVPWDEDGVIEDVAEAQPSYRAASSPGA